MPVLRKTLPKKAEAWKDYATRQYYEVYKPKGYTFAETLKALGEKNRAGSIKRRGGRGSQVYE